MRSKTNNRSKPIIEPLEQRILFSADPFGLGIDSPDPADATAQILPENTQREPAPTEVFIVDENIPNFQQFITSLNTRSIDAPLVQIYTINSTQSLSHISDILTQHSNLRTVHFISHGDDANLRLGSSTLNNSTISDFERELKIWGESISESGDLLFYGCNLAETTDGQTLVQEIAELTGAEVAASKDLTGHTSLGGDWTLEYTTGDIESESLLLSDDIEAWEAVLATITVTTEVDEVNATDLSSIATLQAAPGGDGISLREAIIAANADPELDTIILPAGNYILDLDAVAAGTPDDQYHGDLDVYNNILLKGNDLSDTTIDGGGLDRVFSFTSNGGGTSTIENIEILNGETSDRGGGGILLTDTTLNLNFVALHDNQSVGVQGGAVYVEGIASILNINDSFITANTAGATDLNDQDGGGIYIGAGLLNIERTEFSENKGKLGGAIFSSATLNIQDASFHNNSANENGGATFAAGLATIDRTKFEENSAQYGGAIAAAGDLHIKDSWFHLNTAVKTGGAIHNDGSATIERTLLETNTANQGGGIYAAGATTINSATFATNVAITDADDNGGEGGALFNVGTTEIYQSTIANNTASNFGAIGKSAGEVKIQSSIIERSESNGGDDIESGVTSRGFNLSDSDIPNALETDQESTVTQLEQTLSDEGGFSKVYALNSDSPAINGGAAIDANAKHDATGAARNEIPDIGAFEYRQTDAVGQLFWTTGDEIFRSTTEYRASSVTSAPQIIISNRTNVLYDLEVDIVNQRLYWTETNASTSIGEIYTAKLDGTDITTLVTGLNNPTGLGLDIPNERFFVTTHADSINGATDNSIEEYNYAGDLLERPVIGNLSDSPPNKMEWPSDVVYNPVDNTIYWADTGPNNSIIQSTGQVNPLTSSADPHTPSNLSLTPGGTSLYWSNFNDFINVIDTDGTNPDTIDVDGAMGIADIQYHPESDTIYAADPFSGTIIAVKADKSGSSEVYKHPDPEDPEDPDSLQPQYIAVASLSEVSEAPSAPVIASLETEPLNYTENSSVSISSNLTLTDRDDTHIESAVIRITGAYKINEDLLELTTHSGNIATDWNAGSGQLSLSGSDTIANYQAAIRDIHYSNNSDNPNTAQRGISIIVNDGETNSTTQSRAISINPVNDAPAITVEEATALNYFEGDGEVAVSSTLLLNDLDDTRISSATIQITSGYNSTEDSLTATNFGSMTSSWDQATGILTLQSSENPESISNYQAALRSVSYENSSLNPDTTTRTVTFTANDGNIDSNSSSRLITIDSVNSSPVITTANTINYTENSSPQPIAPTATVSDPDTSDLDGAVLTIALTTGATTADILDVTTSGDGTGQVNVSGTSFLYEGIEHGTFTEGSNGQSPLTITFNSLTTHQSVQAILQSITYMNQSHSPEPSVGFEIDLTNRDANQNSATVIGNINITATNDAPVIHNLDGIAIVAINDGSTHSLDTNSLVQTRDADLPSNFDGGQLAVTKSGFTADDTLEIDTTGNISLSGGYTNGAAINVSGAVVGNLKDITASTFAIDFNSNATPGRVDEIIQSLQFSSTATGLGIRSIEFTLTDGDGTENGGSDTSTATINIYLSESTQVSVFPPEDSIHTFQTNDFTSTGTTESELETITIISLPASGTLKLGDKIVAINDQISKQQLDGGLLTFTPDPDENGAPYTTFDFHFNSGNKTVRVLAGHNTTLPGDVTTFDPNIFYDPFVYAYKDAAEILQSTQNFGPNGTVLTDISIGSATDTVDANYLSQGSVMFSSFFRDGTLNVSELTAIDTWVNNGGILISTGDRPDLDDLNSHYGLDVTRTRSGQLWNVDNTNHPIINGPFGLVSDFMGRGPGGHFEETDLLSTDTVLARDSENSKPTIILRQVGDGQIVFTSDEGIFRQNMTGGGDIVTPNDILTANIYAWAIESTAPKEIVTIAVNVTPVNDASILTLTDTALYVENANPVLIMPSATVTDIDSNSFNTGAITVTLGPNASNLDVLKISDTSTITSDQVAGTVAYNGTAVGTFGGGELNTPLTIQLNNNADSVSAQEILRSISFESTDNNPGASKTFDVAFSDGDGATTTESSSLTIEAINDNPANTGSLPSEVSGLEDTRITVNLSSIELSDIDDQGLPLSVNIDTANGGTLSVNAAPGIVITGSGTSSLSLTGPLTNLNNYLNNTINITYSHPTPNINGASVDTLNITVNDNGNTGAGGGTDISLGSINIAIDPINDNPTNTATLPTNITVTEDENSPIDLSLINIEDVDNLNGDVTITLRSASDSVLVARPVDGISSATIGSALTLTGSVTALNTYLDSPANLTYKHKDENTNGNNADSISITVNDNGNTGSGGGVDVDLGTIPINIGAANDAPTLVVTEPESLNYSENSGAIPVSSNLLLADIDTNFLAEATVTISNNFAPAEDTLTLGNNTPITGQWNATTGTLTLSGTATVSQYEAALRSVSYINTSESPSTLSRTVTFQVTDGTESVSSTRDITVGAVNDSPFVTGIETSPLIYTENGDAVTITDSVILTDIDDILLESATISIDSGFHPTEDLLQYNNVAGINASYNTSGNTLTLTGSSSIANYQTAIRSITYENTSEHPETEPRNISITVNDGSADSATLSITANVTPVNDAPEGRDSTVTTFEDTPLLFVLSDFELSDATDFNAHSLKEIVISSPPTAGRLLLDGNAITSASVTALEIANGKLTWEPDTDKHGTQHGEFKFRVVDNGGTDNGGIDTALNENTIFIDVLPVNDPPSGQNATLWALEDINYVFHTADFGFTDNNDLDALNALDSIIIDTLPAAGSLSLFGDPVNTNDKISASDIKAGGLTFLSEPSSNGTNYAQLVFKVTDDGGTSDGGNDTATFNNTLTLNVLDVNDEPSGVNTTIVATEDTPYSIAVEDFGFIDLLDDNALSQVMITTPPQDGELVYDDDPITPGAVISIEDIADGALTYIPASSVNGNAVSSIGFRVIDDGGTDNGGIDTARSEATISIDITAVNDPPIGSNTTLTAIEDTPYLLSSDVFGFSDIDQGDTLSAVIIDSVNGNGTLTANGTLVTAGQAIDRDTINNGALFFNPSPNTNGPDHTRIDFRVVDSGSPALGLNTAIQHATLVFDVMPVNDAPSSIFIPNPEITENTQNTLISDLMVTDNDSNDSHTLTVDDNRFEIINGQLSLKPDLIIDFETEPEIPLAITAIDESGESFTQLVTLLVTDTNDAPVTQLTPEPLSAATPFSFALPPQTFVDQDDDQLTYNATLENGDPLPTWIRFDPSTQEFTIRTPALPVNSLTIVVTANDSNGLSATTAVQLTLEPEFAPALPSEPALETTSAELAPETTEEPDQNETESESEMEDELKLRNSQQDQQLPEDDAELPLPLEIPRAEFTVLGIELIQTKNNLPVKKAAEAQFIEVNTTQQQQAKEHLVSEATLRNLANQMNDGKQQLQEPVAHQTKVLGTSVTVASSLSVGYIFWILRSGTLLASILSSLPAWKYIDPLPVLGTLTGSDDDTDQETLESMVEEIPETEDLEKDNDYSDKNADSDKAA